jgi:hypothetical protein
MLFISLFEKKNVSGKLRSMATNTPSGILRGTHAKYEACFADIPVFLLPITAKLI